MTKKEDLLQDSINKKLEKLKPTVSNKEKEQTNKSLLFNKIVMIFLAISIIIGLITTLLSVFNKGF